MPTDTTTLNAETGYLGALINAPTEAQTRLLHLTDPTDFYEPRHRVLHETITTMHTTGTPVDTTTLTAWIQDHGILAPYDRDRIGSTLHTITRNAPPTVNADHYAQLTREHAARRLIQQTGRRLTNTWATPDLDDLDEIITTQLRACQAAIEHAHNPANTPAHPHTTMGA